ncbi:hypothetical protein [Rhizobium leguminosarum]|uniref:hypothetical protein n=1 Tax=Rhizobium leguminosarum TaxID=384 RepID=UPI001A9318B0|nr:hypothetical protein [Rhizobium leguminosarum]MBY5725239.1 hypothetical protein [Rhizobium leguminosarum]QSW27116.1 hypothetical protein J0664_26585 [Rhizobium leguminosarum]
MFSRRSARSECARISAAGRVAPSIATATGTTMMHDELLRDYHAHCHTPFVADAAALVAATE